MANRERQRLSRLQKKEIGLATMLLCVVVVFLLCNVWALISNVAEAFYGITVDQLVKVSNLLVTINSSVNFVIYVIFGEKFKRLFFKLFFPRGVWLCGRWRPADGRGGRGGGGRGGGRGGGGGSGDGGGGAADGGASAHGDHAAVDDSEATCNGAAMTFECRHLTAVTAMAESDDDKLTAISGLQRSRRHYRHHNYQHYHHRNQRNHHQHYQHKHNRHADDDEDEDDDRGCYANSDCGIVWVEHSAITTTTSTTNTHQI